MLDGAGLRQSWYQALENAQTTFRQHLTSHSSPDWKRVNVDGSQSSAKGKARASAGPHLTDVIVHRKVVKGESVYRAVLDIPTSDEPQLTLEACKAVLATPELRKEWDPAVERAQLLEMFDQATRISKTNFTLGWPVSPRDAVTISRTFNDATTLIDISTSLPRSPDEPAFLRPSPPYVRSHVGLFAWCIQAVQHSNGTPRLRFTCFWQHDLRALWNFGTTFSIGQQLCAMMVGFYKTVKTRGLRIPLLTGYGNGVSVERVCFQIDREALTVDYAIVPEEDDQAKHSQAPSGEQGLEELHAIREQRRLTRSVEWTLPAGEGWDVQITTKASSEQVQQLPWTAHAVRDNASATSSGATKQQDKFVLNVKHAALPNDHAVLKVRVVIELSGPSSGWRLNGIPQPIQQVEERDPSYYMSQPILQDTTSMADISFRSMSTQNTVNTAGASSSSTIPEPPQIAKAPTERSAAAERSILSRVKRNYIYFSSLLQEPEAKWKRTTEARGVSVAQLDSIDPTLVVYRAEATFVGLGVWDLFAAINTPGARAYWDKLYDDALFLEDVNQLTELWHFKTKPAWPLNGRDAVVLKTVYKSPTTIHVFAFSADDPNLFPAIPPADPNVIRTQIDLQGWAIEALSPTTTLVTLLEQSDPKGWSNKASIPQQMISAVAGVGDFVIKCGGPPVVTRLEGAKANEMRYDHEKGSFRIEYESAPSRTSSAAESGSELASPTPMVECELRCDLDNWATSLDIVIDPPPQTIICLRRHKFSSAGGGLWLTVTHDAIHAGDERLQAIVRRSPQGVAKEKGLVMVNGAKVDVDVEELPEKEVKSLAKQKRVKPARIPLDQPPVLGVIRRRRAEWDADEGNTAETPTSPTGPAMEQLSTSAPAFATSFTRYWNYAIEQATTTTQQAVAAVSPAIAAGADAVPSASKPPMQYALEALSYLQGLHTRSTNDGWTLLSDKGFPVHRKIEPEISSVIPVHRAEKVIEGVSADEIANVLASYECRRQWDNRFDTAQVFESFGALAHTAFVTHKAGFPFRDRGFYLASLMARATLPRRAAGDAEHSSDNNTAIFLVSASFSPESVASFSQAKYNPHVLPIGRIFLDGWILETLDPYGAENYAIPSTRCYRVSAVDYAGSIPAAVNSSVNAALPRAIVALETYLKTISPPPFIRIPPAGVLISTRTEADATENAWAIRRRDSNHILVASKYSPVERSYRTTVLLMMSNARPSSPTPNATERTPRPSTATIRAATPSRNDSAASVTEEATPTPKSPTTSKRSDSRDVRSTSSMFTVRGEVKHPTDLLIGELVVDTKLYPDGYAVSLRSRTDKSKNSLSLSEDASPTTNLLPISSAVFTMPPSPLLSSGLSTDRPPCQLLRFTLPTAQYQMSTIQDPLTGETRTAPPKPQWMLDFEDGRAVIDVEIRAASGDQKGKVTVDGNVVAVLSEKESLTSLGRDELLDGRTSKMDLLVRTSADETVPDELQSPVAVATHLMDRAAPPVTEPPSADDAAEGQAADTPPASSPVTDEKPAQDTAAPQDGAAAQEGGFRRFLNSYPLARFTGPTRPILRSLSGSTTAPSPEAGEQRMPGGVPGALQSARSESVAVATRTAAGTYPLSMVIVVALIAFLIGSLLRSMLSPADFVYVVHDLGDAQDVGAGWREIRRLLEVKYIVGGWDFQVALVRRQ